MKKVGILSIIGLCLVAWFIIAQPFADTKDSEESTESFSSILRAWGDRQSEASDVVVGVVGSAVEDNVVGPHEIDGSNWSIPNIIRHWMGVG